MPLIGKRNEVEIHEDPIKGGEGYSIAEYDRGGHHVTGIRYYHPGREFPRNDYFVLPAPLAAIIKGYFAALRAKEAVEGP